MQFCFELYYIPLSEPNTFLPSRNEIVGSGRVWLLNESDISMNAKKTNKDGIYVTYIFLPVPPMNTLLMLSTWFLSQQTL